MHLSFFQDETEVRKILKSHGFEMTDLTNNQVRVKGYFLKLKAAKARLEKLLQSESQNKMSPHLSSPVPTVSSGAIPKYYTNKSTEPHGDRGRSGSRDKPQRASLSSPDTSASWLSKSSYNRPTSLEYRASSPPRADQRGSLRQGSESFLVDADVFRYAERLRKADIDKILKSHNAKIVARECGESVNITLQGRNAKTAVSNLQRLLNDLNKSLRTQEVPLKDMDREGSALLATIRKHKNIYDSVLVCEMSDRLHLIGSSVRSYELKQKLLGRPVGQSQRTGRTFEKNSRGRSSSLPPMNRKSTERDNGAIASSSPAGAAGYSPSKYQDDKQEGAKHEWGARARPSPSGALRRGSHSESRMKKQTETANGFVQETESKRKPPKLRNPLQVLSPKNIKKALKSLRK